MKRIAIIGAGGWGTALAITLARKGRPVQLWAYEPEVVESISRRRVNEFYLSGREIPDSVTVTNELGKALQGAEIVLTVMPSHVCRALFEQMVPSLRPEMNLVSATKGIETESLMRVSQIIRAVVGRRF